MLSCKKHKSPSQFMCLNIQCSEPRFCCGKCLDIHSQHEQNVIPINQDSSAASNLENKKDEYFTEISNVINSQNECQKMVTNVFKNLQKVTTIIDALRKQLEEVFAVQENDQSIQMITDVLFSQKSDYQDKIEEIIKKISIQNSENLKKIEKYPHEFYDVQLLNSIKAIQDSKDIISSFLEKNKCKNNVIVSSNEQSMSKNTTGDIQRQSSIKLASKGAKSSEKPSLSSTLDSIINNNPLFKQHMDIFLKTKPDFTNISKIINPNIPYQIEFDGSSKGNSGSSGAGFALKEKNSGKIIKEYAIPVGNMTCNQSEYLAAIYGLYVSLKVGVNYLTLQGDSMLVINQLKGDFQVKSDNIVSRHELAKQLTQLFKSCTFQHVKREFNQLADRLSNDALVSCIN